MLDDNGGTLRAVAWSEIFPWLKLLRCFRLAIRFRLLLLSAVAVLLTFSGWAVLGFVFSGSEDPFIVAYRGCPWLAVTRLVPDRPGIPGVSFGPATQGPIGLEEDTEAAPDEPPLKRSQVPP